MPNKERKQKVVDNPTIPPISQSEGTQGLERPILDEEKVGCLIKEKVMINPRDFSAFKHALEDFVNSWDK